MDINKFYELRTQLYKTAAAGCNTISEDFRLKRAVEDFKPLASANKGFGMLYELCEKLFSEKPETVLPDCIALAAALTVAQGTFADNAETTPAAGTCVPVQELASVIDAICWFIRRRDDHMLKISPKFRDTLRDPRIVIEFLKELEKDKYDDKNYDDFWVFCEVMCDVWGKDLVPLLKASVKSSGRQLQYIVKLSGDEENEFFRALATDTKTPRKLRLAAVSALSCSLENSDLLVRLFNTGRGRMKPAALLAMIEMDAPETEPIIEKLLENWEKNKSFLADVICESGGKACTEFVRNRLLQLKHDSEQSNFSLDFDMDRELWMLRNKTELDDVFLGIEEYYSCREIGAFKGETNGVLMWGLSGKNRDAVRRQIDRLYAKEPENFVGAKAFSDFVTHPEKKPDLSGKDDYACCSVLDKVYYIPLLGGYYIRHFYHDIDSMLPLLPCFKKLPEWVFQYFRDVTDKAEKQFNDLQAHTRDEMVKKAESLGFKNKYWDDSLEVACVEILKPLEPLPSALCSLLKNCAPEEYEHLKQTALYVARKCIPFDVAYNFTTLISDLPEISFQEYAYMIVDKIVNDMVIRNFGMYQLDIENLSNCLTNDEMLALLSKLRARVSEWRGRMDDEAVNITLQTIDDNIREVKSKG